MPAKQSVVPDHQEHCEPSPLSVAEAYEHLPEGNTHSSRVIDFAVIVGRVVWRVEGGA
jgi:hypothetical protein